MKYWRSLDKYDIRQLYYMFLVRKAKIFNSVSIEFVGYDDGSIVEVRHLYPEIKAFLAEHNNMRS